MTGTGRLGGALLLVAAAGMAAGVDAPVAAPPAAVATAGTGKPLRSPLLRHSVSRITTTARDPAEVEEEFWEGIVTPLVEPAPGLPGWSLVTFLWRDDGTTRSVALQGGRPSGEASAPLERIPGTGIWYRTDVLPDEASFSYTFVLDAPAEMPDRIDEFVEMPESRPDPRNPARNHGQAYVVLPGAPPFPYPVNPTAPHGRVVERTVPSVAVGDTIALTIYLPPDEAAAPERPPRLAILFDGGFEEMATVLDDLIATRRIPPTVVVGIQNRKGMRVTDLGYSEPFAQFVATELLPWAQSEFRTTTEPSGTILGGASRGAGMTAFVGLRYPERFPNLLCIATAIENLPGAFPPARFWLRGDDAWIIDRYVEAPKRELRFFLAVGRFDTSLWTDRLLNNRRFRDVLRAKGYPVTFADPYGGHDHLLFQRAYVSGLVALSTPP